jgi:hypothetical protein
MTITDLIQSGAVKIQEPQDPIGPGHMGTGTLIVMRPLTPEEQAVWDAYQGALKNQMLP